MKGVIKSKKKIAVIIIILGIIALSYGLVEPQLMLVNEVTISNSDIPVSFDNSRIVFLSDIHHGPYFKAGRVKELVERVNALKPDIILLGGDYIYKGWRYMEPVFSELKHLKATTGKYGVLGNHDRQDIVLMTEIMNEAGIELLNNKAVWVEKGSKRIKIGGVGDLYKGTQDISPTINDVAGNDFVVLLSHNPDYAEQIRTPNIDYVLSGHTHGGQITLFGLWAPSIPSKYGQKYRAGIAATDYTKVLVSKGIGTVFLPLRFFARPEVLSIQLKSQ